MSRPDPRDDELTTTPAGSPPDIFGALSGATTGSGHGTPESAAWKIDPWFFDQMIDLIDVMILVLDPTGRVLLVNDHGARTLGGSVESIAGRSWFDEFVAAGCRADVRQMFDEVMAGRAEPLRRVECRIRTFSGEERIVIWHQAVLRDAGGQIVASVSSGTDVTEQRSEETERHQAQRLEAVGRLAGGIAHDFNNILAAILGYAEIAADDVGPDGDLGDCVSGIIRASERARDLVRQILSFSRQDSDRNQQPVRLARVLEDSEKLLRASLPTTIRICTNVRAPAAVVTGDPTQIEQVIINLGANAADAMQISGGVLEISLDQAEASREDATADSDHDPTSFFRISVRDTGCGMTESVLARAFDPYFTTKPPGQGTGLGLSAVHGIVTRMGGTVRAHSRPGEGSCFEVLLPGTRAAGWDTAPSISLETRRTTHPARLILVDDEASLVQLGKQLLERIGHQVTTFTAGAEALECFRDHPKEFDLLVTDLTMPAMTGDVLAREITAIRPGFPVILCTGNAERLSTSRTRGAGVRRIMVKPYTVDEIDSCICQVLAEQVWGPGPLQSPDPVPVEVERLPARPRGE